MSDYSNNEPLVTIDEIAKHLKLSVQTIRGWVRRGVIPKGTYIHVGQAYRFHLGKVLHALENNTPTVQPVENDPTPVQLELDFKDDENY